MKHQIEIPKTALKSEVIVRLASILARKEPNFSWSQDLTYCDATVTIPRYYDVPSIDFLTCLESYAVYLSLHESLTIELSHVNTNSVSDDVAEIAAQFKQFYLK